MTVPTVTHKGDMFQVSQWMLETADCMWPCIYNVFTYTYTPMMKFKLLCDLQPLLSKTWVPWTQAPPHCDPQPDNWDSYVTIKGIVYTARICGTKGRFTTPAVQSRLCKLTPFRMVGDLKHVLFISDISFNVFGWRFSMVTNRRKWNCKTATVNRREGDIPSKLLTHRW